MDGMRWYHAPLVAFAWLMSLFRKKPKVSRSEVEAMVDRWQADWVGQHKRDAVDDIMWLLDRR